MRTWTLYLTAMCLSLFGQTIVQAQSMPEAFSTGPVIEAYGPVADVTGSEPLSAEQVFKVSFDVADGADPGELNRSLVTAARFINMHARAGVDPDNIHLAIVVHGSAVIDMTNASRFEETHGEEAENANADLIAVLQSHGVEFIVCGQSASFQSVVTDDLLGGVRMALSAMTAHALLQQDGFTLNPF